MAASSASNADVFPPPVPPFASFLPRASAFAIDLVLIYFAGYTLEMAARNQLLALGPALPALSMAAAFAYFWLGNGPAGNGATLGKAILNLRVIDASARPLGLGTSFRRTALQLPAVAASFIIFALEFARLTPWQEAQAVRAVSIFSTTLLITHAYCILTHPFNRGWHDEWAGSYVTTDPPPAGFAESVSQPPGEPLASRLASHRRLGRGFAGIVFFVLAAMWYVERREPALRQTLALHEAIEREAGLPGFRLDRVGRVESELWNASIAANRQGVMPSAPAANDAATTGTQAAAAMKRDMFFAQFTKRRGALEPADVDDPALRAAIDSLRARLPEILKEREPPAEAEAEPATGIVIVLRDRFEFAVFPLGTDRQWTAHGPLDPAAGPLEFDWIREIEKKPGSASPDAARP